MNRCPRPAASALLLAVVAAAVALPCAAGRVKEYGGGTQLHGLAINPTSGTPFFTGFDDSLGFWANGAGSGVVSGATDLGPTDTNGRGDVHVRDLTAGTTTLVSAAQARRAPAHDSSAARS